jgi:hypothetical protein
VIVPVHAQQQGATPDAPAKEQKAAKTEQVEKITVTATKRAEDVTKVPISVTAINQESLDLRGMKDFQDVARCKPEVQRGSDQRLQRREALQHAEHGQCADCAIWEAEIRSVPNAAVHHLRDEVAQPRHHRARRRLTETCGHLLTSLSQHLPGHGRSPLVCIVAGNADRWAW